MLWRYEREYRRRGQRRTSANSVWAWILIVIGGYENPEKCEGALRVGEM